MLKRNSSVILLLSSLFVLASCGGQPNQTGLSSSESKDTGLSSSESSKDTGLSSSESSKDTGLSSSDSEPDDPYGNSPMKVSKKNGQIVITSGVQVNPTNETEYQWLNVNLTGSTAGVELKFTFTPAEGEPVVYGADKVKDGCAALVEATSDGFFKVKEAGKYNFYVETVTTTGEGAKTAGIWVAKATEPAPADGYVVSVNGTPIDIADVKAAGSTDKAVYKPTLAANDKVKILSGDTALHFWHYDADTDKNIDDGDEYTVTVAGETTFYVNSESKVYVTAAAPADAELVYTLKHGVSGSAWASDAMSKVESNLPSGVTEMYHISATFRENEEFGVDVTKGGTWVVWYAYSNVEESCKSLVTQSGNNAKIAAAGTYDVYLRVYADGNRIFISAAE